MVDMSISEILDSLTTLNNEQKSTSYEEYWEQITNVSREENRVFEIEEKKLAVSEELLHRCFSL